MSRGIHYGNSHDDDDDHGFNFSFHDNYNFFFFGGGYGHQGYHDQHDDHGFQIDVQGNQWVLTNGHHTQAITGNSVVLHGETYLLVDHFGGGYQTIQSAVDAAQSGATVLVADGTYAEQVSVVGSGKDGLTIEAADDNNVVITAPATLVKTADAANTGRDMVGLVTVDNADHVTIKDVTVDGAQRGGDVPAGDSPTLVGIAYVNSDGGAIDHVDVTGIRESDAAFGNQRGVGIYVTNDDPSSALPHTPSAAEAAALNSIEITHSTVEDFQKGGIVVSYADVDIHDNTVIGHGPTITAQNGIQVSNSTGSIDDNDISAIGYTGSYWGASGILSFQNRDLVIDDNTIAGTDNLGSLGIYQIDSIGGKITHNAISSVAWAVDAEDYLSASWPDPLQPGGSPGFNFDYSSNALTDIGYNGVWFQPDAASTAVFRVTGTSADDAIFGAAGNDTLKGEKGSDYLSGEAGNDTLSGGKGDDTLTGGAGNDSIVGDSGIDTAVFAGSYDAYAITQFGQQTKVNGPDGLDVLKEVEWLQFDDGRYDVAKSTVYHDDASIDVSAQDPVGQMIAGSGLAADGFGIVRNEKAGVELALKVHNRFDSPTEISHSDADGYADGVLHFQVDAGPGNPPTNTRAEWNFDFSIATGLNGATTDLSDFTFKLKYDVDKTASVDYRVLTLEAEATPQAAGQSGFQWRDHDSGFVFINDDEGNANVTQNSENYGFSFIQQFIDDNPSTPAIDPYNFGPGEFDIALEAYKGSALIAANHMVVDVV